MGQPLEKEQLEEYIRHAKTRRWNADNDSPTNYSSAANVFAYCAEQLAQYSSLLLNELREETRESVLRGLFFTTGVVGRTAELEGGGRPSLNSKYDSEEGNQIDIFLREIGYLKDTP